MEKTFFENSSWDLLGERYPELVFLLSLSESYEAVGEEEFTPELKNVEILYIYGMSGASAYPRLKKWVLEEKTRRVVFLEDDLDAIAQFLSSIYSKQLLQDSQMFLCYLSEPYAEKLEEIASSYPVEHIFVQATPSYRNKPQFEKLCLQLLRITTIAHASTTEILRSHQMLANLMKNISFWPHSFLANRFQGQFANIPAIICGAGPSLLDAIEQLKNLDDRALILAGGSAITALSNQGVIPHLSIAADPNFEEFERLKAASAYETPLIYATRVQPDIWNTCNGQRGYLVSDTGGACEKHFENLLGIDYQAVGPDLGAEALSVTTLSLAFAVEMGCNPIVFVGVDLSYTDMQRYAKNVIAHSKVDPKLLEENTQASEKLLNRRNTKNELVYTTVKWVMESECIASFAKKHADRRFINATNGLGFTDIENASLEEISSDWKSIDLHALIHQKMQLYQLDPDFNKTIASEKEKLQISILRLKEIVLQMLQIAKDSLSQEISTMPTAKMILLEFDLQEEHALHALFPFLDMTLDRLLDPSEKRKEDNQEMLKHLLAKYNSWKEILEYVIEQNLVG
ncbi:MAG: motility associated factor glycosyltransferase family protein [Candidatus Rhabdochlamydia sp.]